MLSFVLRPELFLHPGIEKIDAETRFDEGRCTSSGVPENYEVIFGERRNAYGRKRNTACGVPIEQ